MRRVKRIVVGQNANNKSAIIEDSYAQDIKEFKKFKTRAHRISSKTQHNSKPRLPIQTSMRGPILQKAQIPLRLIYNGVYSLF